MTIAEHSQRGRFEVDEIRVACAMNRTELPGDKVTTINEVVRLVAMAGGGAREAKIREQIHSGVVSRRECPSLMDSIMHAPTLRWGDLCITRQV